MISRSNTKLKPLAPRPAQATTDCAAAAMAPCSATAAMMVGSAGPHGALQGHATYAACGPSAAMGQPTFDPSRMQPGVNCANKNAFAGANLGVPASPLEAITSMDPKDYVWGTPSAGLSAMHHPHFPPLHHHHPAGSGFFAVPPHGVGTQPPGSMHMMSYSTAPVQQGMMYHAGMPGTAATYSHPVAADGQQHPHQQPAACVAPVSGAPPTVPATGTDLSQDNPASHKPLTSAPSFDVPDVTCGAAAAMLCEPASGGSGAGGAGGRSREAAAVAAAGGEVDVEQLLDSVIDLDDESLQSLLEGHPQDKTGFFPAGLALPSESPSDGSSHTGEESGDAAPNGGGSCAGTPGNCEAAAALPEGAMQGGCEAAADAAMQEAEALSLEDLGLRNVASFSDFGPPHPGVDADDPVLSACCDAALVPLPPPQHNHHQQHADQGLAVQQQEEEDEAVRTAAASLQQQHSGLVGEHELLPAMAVQHIDPLDAEPASQAAQQQQQQLKRIKSEGGIKRAASAPVAGAGGEEEEGKEVCEQEGGNPLQALPYEQAMQAIIEFINTDRRVPVAQRQTAVDALAALHQQQSPVGSQQDKAACAAADTRAPRTATSPKRKRNGRA